MPELPEVESIADELRLYVVKHAITDVVTYPSKIFWYPEREELVNSLVGRTVRRVQRKGKFLFFTLSNTDRLLVFHLGMTGHLLLVQPSVLLSPHTHLRLILDTGKELRFDDTRSFGRILFGTEQELVEREVLPELGIEPFSSKFSPAYLADHFAKSRKSVKAVLLDQSVVAGLGNIYVDEACFLAGIYPGKPVEQVSSSEIAALHSAIQTILQQAIQAKGTTFSDYRGLFGNKGGYQEELRVYGREGNPCVLCKTPIRKTQIAGRGTHYCPRCQPEST